MAREAPQSVSQWHGIAHLFAPLSRLYLMRLLTDMCNSKITEDLLPDRPNIQDPFSGRRGCCIEHPDDLPGVSEVERVWNNIEYNTFPERVKEIADRVYFLTLFRSEINLIL